MSSKSSKLLIGVIILILLVIVYARMYKTSPASEPTSEPSSEPTSSPTSEPSTSPISPSVPPVSNKNANIKIVQDYTKQLNDTTDAINKTISVIKGTFGKIGNFYVTGQASVSDSVMNSLTKIDSKNVMTTDDCVNNAPKNTNILMVDPKTRMCSYYSSSTPIPLSSMSTGAYIIGSTTF